MRDAPQTTDHRSWDGQSNTDPLCQLCGVRHAGAAVGCPHADCPHKRPYREGLRRALVLAKEYADMSYSDERAEQIVKAIKRELADA